MGWFTRVLSTVIWPDFNQVSSFMPWSSAKSPQHQTSQLTQAGNETRKPPRNQHKKNRWENTGCCKRVLVCCQKIVLKSWMIVDVCCFVKPAFFSWHTTDSSCSQKRSFNFLMISIWRTKGWDEKWPFIGGTWTTWRIMPVKHLEGVPHPDP